MVAGFLDAKQCGCRLSTTKMSAERVVVLKEWCSTSLAWLVALDRRELDF
jgi:hypothetical protein